MMMVLCRKLQPKPAFLGAVTTHLRFDRNALPAATHFFSTEAVGSTNEDGKGTSSNPKSSDKVEATKTLLKRYGFTDTHLSKLYSKRPDLFTEFHPETTLLPKLDFFRGTVGFSNSDLPHFICSNPSLLSTSLQNQIVPVYNFIKDLLSSDDYDNETVLKTLKRGGTRLLSYSLKMRIASGISALTQAGVSHKNILQFLRTNPTLLGSLCLGESIKRATQMGFRPETWCFVEAIMMFTKMSKSTWDKKMEAYRRCGLSDEEILKAFRSSPRIMSFSEGKIEQTMDFVCNKMGWKPAYIAGDPVLLGYSLEKRIIPRCTLVKYLQAKGLLRRSVSLKTILRPKEKDFRDTFVNSYKIEVPNLIDIYLGKSSSERE